MYHYLTKVKNPENLSQVAEILAKVQSNGIITEGSIQYQLAQFEKLKNLGEDALYEKIIEDLKSNPTYSKYLR